MYKLYIIFLRAFDHVTLDNLYQDPKRNQEGHIQFCCQPVWDYHPDYQAAIVDIKHKIRIKINEIENKTQN